jgi:hypothetical protein
LSLKYQSRVQFLTRLRADYESATGERTALLATLILGWIDSGDVADADMRAAFGLSVAQWAQLKQSTIVPQRDALAAVRGARGR